MKKAKPRTENKFDLFKKDAFKCYIREMEEATKSYNEKNPELSDIKFFIFQTITNKNVLRDMIFNLAYFYDTNYTGNKDFIHIPNISTILKNILNHPIMVATHKDENGLDEILGVCTIKIQNFNKNVTNPIFPMKSERVLTLSNILTKLDAHDKNGRPIKGIGKELLRASIKAAYELNKIHKLRLIGEVDCRNMHSYTAIEKAVSYVREECPEISLSVEGYYELLNQDGDLKEAPTFILEINLESKELEERNYFFDYSECDKDNLFVELTKVVESNTKELKEYVNVIDDGIIAYHQVESFDAFKAIFDISDTAQGNERVPEIPNLQYQTAQKNMK